MTRLSHLAMLTLLTAIPLASIALPAAAQEVEAEEAAAEVTLPAISVSAVTSVVLRDRVVASGLVAATELVQVQPLVGGEQIETLLADIGDTVTEGQVLARLSGSALDLQRSQLEASRAQGEAAIAQSEANLIDAQTNAEEALRVAQRNEALAAQGSIPSAQADNTAALARSAEARVRVAEQGIASAQAQLAVVDAQLASLELDRARIEVRSPAAGLIVARNATVGAVASAAGEPMFTIVRDGVMELRAEISEQDLLRVQQGQDVTMTVIGAAAPIHGTVRLVEPTINTQTRLGVARITVDDAAIVRTGMFLTAEILISVTESLAVPVSAVGSGPDGSTVLVVRDGVATSVAVTTTVRDGALIGIAEGLNEGDLVVTRAAAFVRDGDQINPVTADGVAAVSEEG